MMKNWYDIKAKAGSTQSYQENQRCGLQGLKIAMEKNQK